MTSREPLPTPDDVRAAAARIASGITHTPLVRCAALSGVAGGDVFLKLENRQRGGSFKIRGALHALLSLSPSERAAGVVAASAGNHGRGVAEAAEGLGIEATVFVPSSAPQVKRDGIAAHGATVDASAPSYDAAEVAAREFARRTGATFVGPCTGRALLAGAGTVALEIIEEWPSVDAIVVPVGGGGLISGVALAAKAVASDMEVIGIEAAASPAFVSALAAGRVVTVDVRPTIADGLAGNMDPESRTFGYVKALVDRVALATEPSLEEAVRVLASCDHVIAEGAGGAGVAGLLEGLRPRGRNVAVVVSGANIDVNTLTRALTVPRPEAETPRSATGSP